MSEKIKKQTSLKARKNHKVIHLTPNGLRFLVLGLVTWLLELVNRTSWMMSSRAFRTMNFVFSMMLRSTCTVPEKVQAERSGLR